MNPFPSQTTRATEISIYPVNNGWVLIFPEVQSQTELSSMIPQMIKGIKSALPGNEIDEIIQRANEGERQDVEQPAFVRNVNVYVFATFEKLLAFLKVQIDE